MEISRKTDYALRMIASLVRQPEGVISVRSAAKENAVPYSFARSIQHDLTTANIVESLRGAHGGMRLAVDPSATSLLEVIEAIQGPLFIAACSYSGADDGPCPFLAECHYNPVWCNAERMLRDYFASVTLRDIVIDGKMPRYDGVFTLVDVERDR